ncbi:unnamed protein product, partial [Dovyalis caffra]
MILRVWIINIIKAENPGKSLKRGVIITDLKFGHRVLIYGNQGQTVVYFHNSIRTREGINNSVRTQEGINNSVRAQKGIN